MMPRAYSVSVVRTFVRYYARMSVHTYVRDPIRLWFKAVRGRFQGTCYCSNLKILNEDLYL